MAITRDDVFRVCDEIFSQGKKPVIEAVRTLLGSGSFSTISKYLREWKEQSPQVSEVSVKASDLPVDIRAAAYEALDPIIALIWDKASESLSSQRVTVLETENERFQQQTVELAGLRSVNRELLTRIEQLSQELALAKAGIGLEEADTLQFLQSECSRTSAQLEQLQKDYTSLEEQFTDAQTTIAGLQSRLQSVDNQRVSLAQENQELKIDNARIEDLERLLHEKDEAIAHLQKQVPQKSGLAPLEVDAPNTESLFQEIQVLKVQLEVERNLRLSLEQSRYLATLASEATPKDVEFKFTPASTFSDGLTAAALAKRLGVSTTTLSRRQKAKTLNSLIDSDGLIWEYKRSLKKFYPVSH